MTRLRVLWFAFLLLAIAGASDAVAAAKQYQLRQDPQAIAVAQAAFAAMGGAQAVAAYQDSLSSGTFTTYSGGSPVSYPITIKSKGLRETRVELQMATGTNLRIVNQGQGAIQRPDGSVRVLDSNNTFYEYVNHVPLLSVLADYVGGSVNLLFKGVVQVQGQSEDVIEIDFIPDLANGPLYASMSSTLFFVNQTTWLVDKIQRSTFYEGDQNHTFSEETYFADYRPVSGMMVPFHQTVFIDGQLDTDLRVNSVSFNVGLFDSEFGLPKAR